MFMEMDWNTKEAEARLRELVEKFPKTALRAVREEAEIEMTEAKKRTPVDTGALRASGYVDGPAYDVDGDIVVRYGFGGPSAPYALQVHEDLEAFHKVGQAKFLESVLRESGPHMAQRVAERIREIKGL